MGCANDWEMVDAIKAALSANGGEAVVEIDIRRSPVDGTPEPRILRFTDLGDGAHKLYTRPAPPSVAVPELNGEPPVTILGVLSSYARPSLKENGVSDQQVDAWFQGLKKLLTAAPSPDHIADAGKVVPENEIKARALEEYADQLDVVFANAQEAGATDCPAWHAGQFAKDARKQAARLRTAGDEGDV